MQAGRYDERRAARAQALARQLEADPRVLYADASLPQHSSKAVAAVTTIDKLGTSASVRMTDPSQAEEVAIALGLKHVDVKTIVKYPKTAYGHYRKGIASHAALGILAKRSPPGRDVELVLVPAYSTVEGNALADHYARELAGRAEDESDLPGDYPAVQEPQMQASRAAPATRSQTTDDRAPRGSGVTGAPSFIAQEVPGRTRPHLPVLQNY